VIDAIYLQYCVTLPIFILLTFTRKIIQQFKKLLTMKILEEHIILKITGDKTTQLTSNSKSHNPGLRALLAIKNFNATLENDYGKLLQIENDLAELNNKGLLMIESKSSPEAIAQWKQSLDKLNNAVKAINEALSTAKEKIEQNIKDGFPELWGQLAVHLSALRSNSTDLISTGLLLQPEADYPQWEKEFSKHEIALVQSIISHVESCRVLLQMIERYTPDELNAITKIIVDQIPLDFTYEEAVEYQNDYYKALVNFKKEFKEEKNLWDKFLDILAGGTHQPPSERVMMERWLDGDKGDL